MAASRSLRWLFAMLVVIGGLAGLGFMAMAKPDVVWAGTKTFCPQCRSPVAYYATRCPACRESFDWVKAPDAESPACRWCLSAGEDEHLRARIRALSGGKAEQAVAAGLGLRVEAARDYLRDLGRGACGWCGGSGLDLGALEGAAAPCPVCLGGKRCIACGGDRVVTVGHEDAATWRRGYLARLEDLGGLTPADRAREEARQANSEFLRRYTGTLEAESVVFWPEIGREPPEGTGGAVVHARQRLSRVEARLRGD